jgi:hypothetical protein
VWKERAPESTGALLASGRSDRVQTGGGGFFASVTRAKKLASRLQFPTLQHGETYSNSLAALVDTVPTFGAGIGRFSITLTSRESGITYHLHLSEDEALRFATLMTGDSPYEQFHPALEERECLSASQSCRIAVAR